MGTIRLLPSGRFNAQVRVAGFKPLSRTHESYAAAQAWAQEQEAELLSKRAKSLGDGQVNRQSFTTIVQSYLGSQEHKAKRETTRRTEVRCTRAVLRLLGDYRIEYLDAPTLQREFFDVRTSETYRGRPTSGDTIRLEKALISAVFNFAVLRGLAKFNPVLRAKFQVPAPAKRLIRISPEQENKILDAAISYGQRRNTDKEPKDRKGDRLFVYVAFLFDTGTRPGEASRIRLEWISSDFSKISIPPGSHKTNIPRVILVRHELAVLLRGQVEISKQYKSPYLFFSIRNPQKPYQYYHPIKTIFSRAGLPSNYVPHGVRHEFISRLFEHTSLSDSSIAKIVGDKTPLSLLPYSHIRTEALRSDFVDFHSQMDKKLELDRLRQNRD